VVSNEPTAIPRYLLMSIYDGIVNYRYRGIPCWKSPLDLAIMSRLIWDVQPRTIIEIGANAGGSALWFGDQLKAFGIDGMVHSVDNNSSYSRPLQDNIKFYPGDARNMKVVFPAEWIAEQPRPILVNEDSDHTAVTSLAVLRWFDSWSRSGEYIIVEDGNTNQIHPGSHPDGGPLAAIKTFMDERRSDYVIERGYCDMFGPETTFFPDGYIRRK
jgi:cephalosporin hydroxylase